MLSKKKVLIIAYLFPPIGGGGVQRALKMAKYLGQFGWEVHVLTVEPSHHVSLDHSLLDQLPKDVHIHRSKELQLWNRSAKTENPTKITPTPTPTPAPAPAPAPADMSIQVTEGAQSSTDSKTSPPKRSIKQFIIALLKKMKNSFLVPDDQILWYPFATRKGLSIMKEHQIDVIFSTSGPYTNHLVGRYLKRKTGKAWIADFRDPWTQNMHHTNAPWRVKLEEKLERQVLRESDCLLTVTKSFANNFKQKYPKEIKRLEVIHNGYDREDYEQLNDKHQDQNQNHNHSKNQRIQHAPNHSERTNNTPNDKFTLIYTGIFYKERNPRLLLKAVEELLNEKVIPKERIHLQFAGVFDYPGNNENMNCVRELGLEGVVEIMGHLPHKKALQAMTKANVLMLVSDSHPDSGNYIPGKLYEYMAIGHPILALSLPGESTYIIEQYQLGEIVDPGSLDQMKKALLKLYQEWKNPPQQDQESSETIEISESEDFNTTEIPRNSIIHHKMAEPPRPSALIYERKEQARMLAELMDELTQREPFN
jgi:glycosyltransferase involved in cell wall biosynthesis